ncbi:MAG: type I-E CRISPR-associated protein Cse1/CasA [Propionibacteriaceae bacterium]|jgi:CRISPR system Cascade subunit CasA|nr:type I-E CRISPR-associated protein Cse1/CasA [Propionibacteriaceae bacterium]
MIDTPSFNLIDKPWIEVRWLDGHTSVESLLTVFTNAGNIEEIVGELPTQAFAILRMLLAILQRAIVSADTFDATVYPDEAWSRLWAADELPMGELSAYLQHWWKRFYLLGGEAPFMQVAGLHTSKDEVNPISKIVAEAPDGHPFFTVRSGLGLDTLSLAEAARWLVHVQAFDTAGIKSGVVGDPEVKGGKSYPIGTGWTGRLGGVWVAGDCLKATLLLNLHLGQPNNVDHWVSGSDLPAWERPVAVPGDSNRLPSGQADLYTWQSRRVRLVAVDDVVTGVILTNGDKLKPHNQFNLEPMSGWRRSPNQEKALKLPEVYLPFRVEAGRAMWRGLDAVLPDVESRSLDGPAYRSPGVVSWVKHLASEEVGLLPSDFTINLRSVGIVYGPHESTVAEVISDQLLVKAALLTPAGGELVALAKDCVADTANGVRQIGSFARNLYLAEGGDSQATDGPRDQATSTAYYELDIMFRRWLADLVPVGGDEDMQSAHAAARREAWRTTARGILTSLAEALTAQTGPQAFTGHANNDAKVPWLTSAVAMRLFHGGLRKALPLATDHPTNTPTERKTL